MDIETKESFLNIARNSNVKKIFKDIDKNYDKMSFSEKETMFKSFNDILNDTFDNSINFFVRKEKNYNLPDVQANYLCENIILNGAQGNPYEYLKEILYYHLAFLDDINYDSIKIGDVGFNSNYTFDYPNIAGYNPFNIENRHDACNLIKIFLNNYDNKYKEDFLNSFDNNLTKETIKEFIKANDILDKALKEDFYEPLLKIEKRAIDLSNKEFNDENHLAPLTIDNILQEAIYNCNNEHGYYYLLKNLNNFMEVYFPEYAPYISFKFKKGDLCINNVVYKEKDLFMDKLFTAMKRVDTSEAVSEGIMSTNKLIDLNTKFKRSMDKFEMYAFLKLLYIDGDLENKNFELVNYAPFHKIFKFNEDVDPYIDRRRIFETLLNDKKFIDTCVDLINSDKKVYSNDKEKKDYDHKLLNEIFEMLNKTYGVNFKLELDDEHCVDELYGNAGEKSIYLNTISNTSNRCLLTTLFHEYRHLMQENELETNTCLYNDKLYSYIKKQNSKDPFGFDYFYNVDMEYGYINPLIYDIQPEEFDAENFSKYMMRSIAKKSNNAFKDDNRFYNDMYARKFNFFDNKKLSFEIYDNSLKFYEVGSSVNEDNESYKELINSVKNATFKTAPNTFKLDNFEVLPYTERNNVYKAILLNPQALEQISNDKIKINNKILDLKKVDNYKVLEEVICNNALELYKHRKLAHQDIKEYIYKESLKYKFNPKELDSKNINRLFYYYKHFNKYKINHLDKDKNKGKTR